MSAFINEDNKSLDLVFCMDCTGSMGPYIVKAKESIESIVTNIVEKSGCNDVLFGLVAYRDHPPQDKTFITKKFNFTNKLETMQSYLNELVASGGGDGPEALTSALFEIKNMEWREETTKIVIVITDAPPHGLGEYGDGFLNGDPDGHDPIIITKDLAKKGITIYSVGCEPEINKYKFARAFLISLANLTGGQSIGLENANSLADVILGSTIEELGITKLLDKVEEETIKVKYMYTSSGRSYTDDIVLNDVYNNLRRDRHVTPQIRGCTMMRDISEGIIEGSDDLASARRNLISNKRDITSEPITPLTKYRRFDDLSLPPFDDLSSPPFGDLSSPPFGDLSSPPFGDLLLPPLESNKKSDKIDVIDDIITKDQVKRLISRNTSKSTSK